MRRASREDGKDKGKGEVVGGCLRSFCNMGNQYLRSFGNMRNRFGLSRRESLCIFALGIFGGAIRLCFENGASRRSSRDKNVSRFSFGAI